jgi:hypothetical protein
MEVLQEAGFSADEIEKLRQAGAVVVEERATHAHA